ncbi:hypothetical protein EDD11_000479, partial [Mortierella claussenii]
GKNIPEAIGDNEEGYEEDEDFIDECNARQDEYTVEEDEASDDDDDDDDDSEEIPLVTVRNAIQVADELKLFSQQRVGGYYSEMLEELNAIGDLIDDMRFKMMNQTNISDFFWQTGSRRRTIRVLKGIGTLASLILTRNLQS